MSKPMNFTFEVFKSERGNVGARLKNNGFTVCGFLNVETGDALFSAHPVLANAWSVAKRDIAKLGGGEYGKEETRSTRVSPEAQPETKRKPGRPRRIAAESVQAQPEAPKTQAQPDAIALIMAQLTKMQENQARLEEALKYAVS